MRTKTSNSATLRLRSTPRSGFEAKWYVLDGRHLVATGYRKDELPKAEAALAKYIRAKLASLTGRRASR